MLRTILFALYFWILFVVTIAALVPIGALRLTGAREAERRYVAALVSWWSRHILRVAGARVTVEGTEHIPRTDRVCFISNHQGYADVPLLLGYTGKRIGIIAKKELARVPIMNIWMHVIGCILIDRKSVRQAHEALEKGIGRIRAGQTMAIFPEGTRSKGPEMNPFRAGSVKLATQAEAVIVPVTIDGTYRLLEEHGRVSPAAVRITIHPPIPTAGMTPEDRRALCPRLERIIREGLARAPA